MAGRIRSIKPEILEDELVLGLSDAAWRLWVSLWVLADDHGNARAGKQYLAAQVWADTLRDADVPLGELVEKGRLHAYGVRGQRYVHINNWERHQRVDNAGTRRVPGPEDDDGSWNQTLASHLAESRGDMPDDAANFGESRLAGTRAHSGGQTPITTPITTTTTGARGKPRAQTDSVKGTRIPEDWKPSAQIVSWADDELDGTDAMACVEEFRDFWLSRAGADARKTDWDRVFKNRLRELFRQGRAPQLQPKPELFKADAVSEEQRAQAAAARKLVARVGGT